MRVKVQETTPVQIDWLVASIENHKWRCPWLLEKEGFTTWSSYESSWGNPTPEYSSEWSHAGQIIERERITINVGWKDEQPLASIWTVVDGSGYAGYKQRGSTMLIAAMRCFIASKLGDTVEIPDELV